MEKRLTALLFPEGLLDYFDVVSLDQLSKHYIFYLDEKNIAPKSYKIEELESIGFYNKEKITDFPLRGRLCSLRLRRRKWIKKTDCNIICRDWNIVAKGTRTTNEFATFLKEFN